MELYFETVNMPQPDNFSPVTLASIHDTGLNQFLLWELQMIIDICQLAFLYREELFLPQLLF